MKKNKIKIIFVLSTLGLTGGVRVIFEHANRFFKKGYEVEIIHLLRVSDGFRGYVIGVLKKIKYLIQKNSRSIWFNLATGIDIKHLFNLPPKNTSDIIIATANETADWVNRLDSKANKFYFVQDYEIWTRRQDLVKRTYKYPLKKITSSVWLKDLLKKHFQEDSLGPVFNGVDYSFFYHDIKRTNKQINILIMYHVLVKKGFKDGLKALKIVKNNFPDIKITSFGAYHLKDDDNLIAEFYYKPTSDKLRSLYASADIFLCPSRQEGFTLPPMEAMSAGCALVSTKVGGPLDYCVNNETALLVPVANIKLLAEAIIKLINNPDLLRHLALKGQKEIKKFTWDGANDLLEDILINN